jgi:hypothetical protein
VFITSYQQNSKQGYDWLQIVSATEMIEYPAIGIISGAVHLLFRASGPPAPYQYSC